MDSRKLTYDVIYDKFDAESRDHLSETGVQRYCVRPWSPFAVGEPVDYFHEGAWVPAEIVLVRPADSMYDIVHVNRFDGHERSLANVPPSAIRRRVQLPAMFLTEGMKIIARHPSSGRMGQWWRGKVREMVSARSVLVEYVEFYDGDVQEVNDGDVRLFDWAS